MTLLSDSHLRAVLTELGLDDEIEWVKTQTGMFADGMLWPITSNTSTSCGCPCSRWSTRCGSAATILQASMIGSWQKLEQVSVTSWLERWSGRRAYERFWLPLLRAKLGEAYRDTSAAFIWATARRLSAARRSGLEEERFGYVPGGYGRVLARFVEVLEAEGVELELGCPVREVVAENGAISIDTVDRTTEVPARPPNASGSSTRSC